jgi:hypothetical protein
MSEQFSPFHAAVTAFEIRFEEELSTRWNELESEAAGVAISGPSEKKRSVLHSFFEDAGKAIASVVHEYLPKLLRAATTQRKYLGNQSPLGWTKAQVLRQVCTFLGVDEKFDHTSPPRDDSRLVQAAARIALNIGWRDEPVPSDFVLPAWAHNRWALSQLIRRAFGPPADDHVVPPADDDAGSLAPLSRAETLEWIKHREFWMSKKLERQIQNDGWDGVIEAGQSDVSVLDAFLVAEQPDRKEPTQDSTAPNEDSFVREATTWVISFGGEICRLKTMIGLDYVFVLLQNPGRPIRALELQTLAGGMSPAPGVLASSLADDVHTKKDFQDDRSLDQSDFGRHPVLDDRARREVEGRLREIETDIAYMSEIGDVQKADLLQQEYETLQSYLGRSLSLHRRPRGFSDENEKARTSITNALKRAYEAIQAQAPNTAAYLKSNIRTGSEFMYRDASRPWKVRRTP